MIAERVELLALSRTLDDICVDNDIEPRVVIEWLIEEGHVKLEDYFPEEEEEDL